MAIEIRLLQDNETELANNFFNNIYQTNRTIDNFRWEFLEGPNGKAIYVIAVDASEKSFIKIVGIQCAIPIEFIAPDATTILTAKSEDTLVHPEYRGQKIFEKMYALLFEECSKAGVKYIWGLTPALKAFERLGFQVPFITTQAIMVFKPKKAFRYLIQLNTTNKTFDKLKILSLIILSYLSGFRRFLIDGTLNTFDEVALSSKDQIIKNFYPRSGNLFFIRQNERYLTWRIAKNPFGNYYRNFQGGKNSDTEVDIIVNIRSEVSYIEQMLFSTAMPIHERLYSLKSILRVVIKSGSPAIRALCFGNNETMIDQIRLLKKAGFVHIARGNHFVWKSLGDESSISVDQIFFSRLFTQGNL